MAVCNAQLLFTNIVSKWHGSVHDSAVFHSSALQVHMENERGSIMERRLQIRVVRKIAGPITICALTKEADACHVL